MARFAIIDAERVTNIIEADAEFAASIGAIDAEGASIGWGYADGVFTPPPPQPTPVPASVSPRQIRQALTRAGLRTSVEAAVAAGDQDTKDWWEFATTFERSNPQVIGMGLLLGVSEEALDDLWILADSL